jgi:hypothetical protein
MFVKKALKRLGKKRKKHETERIVFFKKARESIARAEREISERKSRT